MDLYTLVAQADKHCDLGDEVFVKFRNDDTLYSVVQLTQEPGTGHAIIRLQEEKPS